MTGIIAVIFLVLLIMGMPIGFVLGVTSLIAILNMDPPNLMSVIPSRFYSGADSFPLMAMPLFILAGEIMNKTEITLRLINFTTTLMGHIRGGLGHANILASVFFAGITGSAVADTATIGTMMIPAMERAGYDRKFAAAITAASSCIGPIIPPSSIMVIYGAFMGVSIAGLFAAGIIPGLLMAPGLMALTYRRAVKEKYPMTKKRASHRELLVSFKQASLAFLMPIIILGGILTGCFTPTESGAIAVLYGVFIGYFVYRNLKTKDLLSALAKMAHTTSIVFLILATAAILSWILAAEQIPHKIINLTLSVTNNKYLILLFINVFLLIVGCFMDQTAALLILGPVLAPLAIKIGIHPLHFGMIMCLNLVIGLSTPPLGVCLFTCCSIAGITVEEISKSIWPMILYLLAVLMLVTFVPAVSMTLPILLGFS